MKRKGDRWIRERHMPSACTASGAEAAQNPPKLQVSWPVAASPFLFLRPARFPISTSQNRREREQKNGGIKRERNKVRGESQFPKYYTRDYEREREERAAHYKKEKGEREREGEGSGRGCSRGRSIRSGSCNQVAAVDRAIYLYRYKSFLAHR